MESIDFGLVWFVVLVFSLACALIALGIGPQRYGGRLFVLTLFFMGPLGIATALIMRTLTDIASPEPASAPAPLAAKTSPKAKDKESATPAATPGRKVRCFKCETVNAVPYDSTTTTCKNCQASMKYPAKSVPGTK
jgi:hypothetical protein